MNTKLYRFNFRGGIASPGELITVIKAARGAEVTSVRFGLRQQMLVRIPEANTRFEQTLNHDKTAFQVGKSKLSNIVSSYVGEDVFQKGTWLSEGVYKDIFDEFEEELTLKVNISDARQSFTPFFSGHLNFVSSDRPNFWYLYVRLPKTNEVIRYERLIFSLEIAQVSYTIEQLLQEHTHTTIQTVFDNLKVRISEDINTELILPNFNLPYYEGFNRYGSRSWLGIYRRNEEFSVGFMIELCELCQETNIGEICITPWKSIIIKGIAEGDRVLWSKLLSRHSISVRHASNELNWQLEDDSKDALQLKKNLVKYLNENDVRTFGICFGIKTIPKTEVFASILIRRRRLKLLGVIPLHFIYDISYTKDFDPNGREKIYFNRGIPGYKLKSQFSEAIGAYNQTTNFYHAPTKEKVKTNKDTSQKRTAHQCSFCLTVYDPTYGDELNEIPPNIPFKEVAATFQCSVCNAPKSAYKETLIDYNFITTT